MRTTCPHCHGRGTVVVDACPECSGQGRIRKEVEVTVHIPPGIESGTRLRVRGEGESSPAGPPRRYYRLTPAGRSRLREMESHWQDIRDAVQHLLDGDEP